MVDVDGVCKSYRRGTTTVPVLHDVDLRVLRGECIFLVGPSGSGKSTLLSILGCILSPDAGHVTLLGHSVHTLNEASRVRLRRDRIGFVFQRFQLIRGLSALENVVVPLTLRGVSVRKARRRALALLESVGLADRVGVDTRNLSAGQCQRVAFARALANDPEIILADEPTASLDADTGCKAMELLRRLVRAEGRTAIVVTHDQRIFSYADRVFRVEGGRLLAPQENRSNVACELAAVEVS